MYSKFEKIGDKIIKSKSVSFGMSPRHDARLYLIYDEPNELTILWKSQVAEDLIFRGDGVKTEKDLEALFKLLGVFDFINKE